MSNETEKENAVNKMVKLRPIAELMSKLTEEVSWCDEAEEIFEKATGVKPLDQDIKERPCSCTESCVYTQRSGVPGTRFRLPEGAPEEVPMAPLREALDAYAESLGDLCDCSNCVDENAVEHAALRKIEALLS